MGETHDHDHERRTFSLSEEEFEAIAKRAAELTEQKFYENFGHASLSQLSKVFWTVVKSMIIIGITSFLAWLGIKGYASR